MFGTNYRQTETIADVIFCVFNLSKNNVLGQTQVHQKEHLCNNTCTGIPAGGESSCLTRVLLAF